MKKDNMETLTQIPFVLDPEEIMKQAHIESGSADEKDLLSLIELAQSIGRPKACYDVSFVTGREGDKVRIEEVWFTSRTLAHKLQSVERVFPVIATCGGELDASFPFKGDMFKEFWWDIIKSRLLNAAQTSLNDHLHRKFRLGRTATMRPSSGDASIWPIDQQKDLFALLGNVEGLIGVQLTESFLMVPNKTTSGLLFPTEKDFRSCEVCHREDCPSRSVPFNKKLWEQIQQE